ncbi:MAG: cation transporter [Pseudomonas sp.]|nr:cation transporter [Pseudomonas sp.]HBS78828.1 cation transporter [Pseudomonas sp.]|tara:strand:+ start:26324 stop:26629 length:306 start_codon:yes stop_codon:yes gene_type:complete
MNLQALLESAQAHDVEALDLVSLEGGFYLLSVHAHGKLHVLCDEQAKVIHLRSVEHARDLLSEMPTVPFFLVHSSAYDEMCGLAEGVREPLRVPISLRSAW